MSTLQTDDDVTKDDRRFTGVRPTDEPTDEEVGDGADALALATEDLDQLA